MHGNDINRSSLPENMTQHNYQKIIDIINEPYIDKDIKPNIYGKYIFSDKALVLMDMPPSKKNFHGSSFEFSCFKDNCNVKGQVVVNRKFDKEVSNNIEKFNCSITAVHMHPEEIMYMSPDKEYEKESHIHFKCENKSYDHLLDITKFLRNF